nr:sensor histidine kinase [Sporichthyaceae bacterium]
AVESAIFFICSEALANVAKHAEATSASMEVSMEPRDDDSQVVVTVLDDGVGGADPRGSGLRGLADRVEALGGSMVVSDEPGGGTRLTAVVPVGAGAGGEVP